MKMLRWATILGAALLVGCRSPQIADNPIRVTIESDREVYALTDDMIMTFTVENRGRVSYDVIDILPCPWVDRTDAIALRNLDGKRAGGHINQPAVRNLADKGGTLVLSPGKKHVYENVVISNADWCNELIRKATGRYSVQWSLGSIRGLRTKPVSNTLTIEVINDTQQSPGADSLKAAPQE